MGSYGKFEKVVYWDEVISGGLYINCVVGYDDEDLGFGEFLVWVVFYESDVVYFVGFVEC